MRLWNREWTRWQDWANLVAGIWVLISPWVLAITSNEAASWNSWVVGAVIFFVALWAVAYPLQMWTEWTNASLGIWLFISPWALGFAYVLPTAAWSAGSPASSCSGCPCGS